MITMLKGFLIFIFISSAVALVAIQVSKSPPKPNEFEITQSSEEEIDMDNLVFHTLTHPEDKNKPNKITASDELGASCTTDLECETSLKVAPFEFNTDDNTEAQIDGGATNTIATEEPKDNIEEIINNADAHNQKKEDEILDLIDNLADLQEDIENKGWIISFNILLYFTLE